MRGGLDDALDKLARRDELRRRATGEAPGTPAAVTELVEAVAAVVARHPELGVSVGVEGAGDPLLLHFYLAEGQVQVNAESAAALAPEPTGPRHADVDIEAGEPVDRPYSAQPYAPDAAADQVGGGTRRLHHDDQDRFGYDPVSPASGPGYYAEPDTAERRYGSFDATAEAGPRHPAHDLGDARSAHDLGDPRSEHDLGDPRSEQDLGRASQGQGDPRYPAHDPGESSRDLGARLRDLGMAASSGQTPAYPPHPFAATPPPPVPPQTSQPPQSAHSSPSSPAQSSLAQPSPAQPSPGSHASHNSHAETMPPQPRSAVPPDDSAGATRRIRPEHHRPPAEPSAAERGVPARGPVPEQRSMLTPLPQPIPLQVERPEETEMAARRLAALLRDDPSLLDQPRG